MTTKQFFGMRALTIGTVTLSGVLGLMMTTVHAFEVEQHGSHGAYRIVNTDKTTASQERPQAQKSERRPTIIIRGGHGSQKIVPLEGVGGPVDEGQSKETPDLEGTIHDKDGWF